MECVICKNGKTHIGTTTLTLERNGSIVVVKNAPAHICENCGQAFLDTKATKEVLAKAEEAIKKGAELELVTLQAA